MGMMRDMGHGHSLLSTFTSRQLVDYVMDLYRELHEADPVGCMNRIASVMCDWLREVAERTNRLNASAIGGRANQYAAVLRVRCERYEVSRTVELEIVPRRVVDRDAIAREIDRLLDG